MATKNEKKVTKKVVKKTTVTKKPTKKELDIILKLENITKTFLGGKIVANDDVSLSFARNEVHAIVGENGSGKSTLMNIIFGLYKQDEGDIFLNSKKVNMYESGAAKKYKIGMVHQHFHLVDNFTVLENVILGQEELTKTKEEKEYVKSIKQELKQIIIRLKSLRKIESDFCAKITKIIDLKVRALKEIKKEKNIIQDLKVAKAKISEEKKTKKFNKISDEIERRKEVIEEEKQILKLIDQAEHAFSNKDQEEFVILSERKLEIENELIIHDLKLTGAFGKINKKAALTRLKQIQSKYNIQLDPYSKVGNLAVGQRQMVEILKVLWEEKEILVFDEPTATLSVVEIEALLKTIKALQKEGKTIIFISHKLKEVKEIANRVSVLRKGMMMGTYDNDSKLKPADIGKLMVGKTIELDYPKRKVSKKPVLKVNNLSYRTGSGFKALDDVSFEIFEDEIFGLAGIEGNGQEEIVKVLTNLRKPYKGEVYYQDRLLTNKKGYKVNGKKRREFQSHVPIDRLKHGVVPMKNLEFNAKITDYDTKFFNKKNKLSTFTENIIKGMNVDGAFNHNVELRNLSGGNQQKFVVGREIFRDHKLLIAGHPTRGLDISAIDHIYKTMINNAKGKATLLYSLEINEILAVCDRVAIMYHGKIVNIIDPKKATLEEVSRMMIGEVK